MLDSAPELVSHDRDKSGDDYCHHFHCFAMQHKALEAGVNTMLQVAMGIYSGVQEKQADGELGG
jgi:hypothetical protein